MAKIDEKVKGEMAKVILQDILGKPISLKELKGKKTKEEKEFSKLLTEFHKKAEKRNFFIGDKKRVTRG